MNASVEKEIRSLSIRGIRVDHVTMADLMDCFLVWSRAGSSPRYVCYLNAHVHNLARTAPRLREILNGAALCYADGASIVWASRRLGDELPQRMTAADFFPSLAKRLFEKGRRIYLLGGKPGVAEQSAAALAAQIPGFQPAGMSHGYFDAKDCGHVIRDIQDSQADLLLVGMGSPRQEYWIAEHAQELNLPLVWAVGALLDYIAGEEHRCPRWMGDHGLEWLYRLAANPRRMARRYLLGNPRFAWSVMRARKPKKPGVAGVERSERPD